MKIKNFFKTHQQKIVLSVGYILVAFLGFGLGQIADSAATKPDIRIEEAFAPLNNTPIALDNQTGAIDNSTNPSPNPGPSPAPSTSDYCVGKIKGNIGSKEKIYHLPGTSFYNRTKAETCFVTEDEAKAAGFRKAGN